MKKKKLGFNIQGGFWFFFRIIPNGSREQIWTTSSISSVGIIKLFILHDFPRINMARSLNDAMQNKRCRSGPSFPLSHKGSETGGMANSLVQACTSLVKTCEQLAIATSNNQNSSTHGASTYESIKTTISAFKHLCLHKLNAEEYWVTFKDGYDFYANHLHVYSIEKHVAVINSGYDNSNSGSGGSTNKKIKGGLTINENVINI